MNVLIVILIEVVNNQCSCSS